MLVGGDKRRWSPVLPLAPALTCARNSRTLGPVVAGVGMGLVGSRIGSAWKGCTSISHSQTRSTETGTSRHSSDYTFEVYRHRRTRGNV